MSLMILHWLDDKGHDQAEMIDLAKVSVTEAVSLVHSVGLEPIGLCHPGDCDAHHHERR